MITFPTTPLDYQFHPWTDPNGIQWIYDASIPAWARYRVAATGGGADLSNAEPQPLGIAAAGVATEASRADHVHSDQGLLKYTMMALSTEQKAQARGNIGAGTFSISNADVFGTPDTVPVRDEDGALEAIGFRTLDAANRHSVGSLGFQTGTVIDGATAGASYEIEPPAFTNSADFFRYTMPLGTGKWALTADAQGRPDSLYNATIAGTLTINSTSITFGTGAAAAFLTAVGALPASGGTATNLIIAGTSTFSGGSAAQFRTALGAGTAGNAIFVATAYSGVGSVRALLGLDTNSNVTHAQITANSYFSGDLVPAGTDQIKLGGSAIMVGSSGIISFRSGAFYAAEDFRLARGGTGILAQSGGSNPQKFRVFGTTTGGKYAQLEHDGTNAKLTSSSGDLHISNIPTSNPGPGIIWNDGGVLKIGT